MFSTCETTQQKNFLIILLITPVDGSTINESFVLVSAEKKSINLFGKKEIIERLKVKNNLSWEKENN